jgi:2-polyprenyl-3-methyl-5-hydroxy-6-metoxy-1,4-benzoquinol methylase
MKTFLSKVYQRLKPVQKTQIDKLDFQATYLELVKSLKQFHANSEAMKLAVGGEFEAIGFLEMEMLKHLGLQENAYLIDVGCGSGRLAQPLSAYLKGRYLGIDIVPQLVKYARESVDRSDWRFEIADGLSIPEGAGQADVVCFFSVFTHLLHEQTYVYLQEAKRVLKPGGKIVFSFLDFSVSSHWAVFESNLKYLKGESHPLNMFISKDAICVWAEHLGLQIQTIQNGDEPFVPLSKPVVFEDGSTMEGLGTLGQSVCVLTKGE